MKKKSESAGKNGIGDDDRMTEVYVRKISAKIKLWNGKWQLSADLAVLVA